MQNPDPSEGLCELPHVEPSDNANHGEDGHDEGPEDLRKPLNATAYKVGNLAKLVYNSNNYGLWNLLTILTGNYKPT